MPQIQIIVNIRLVINKMSNIYITSDLHLFHNKDFVYNPRGFDSVEVMIATIVKNWNELINNEDIIYVLGDCILGETEKGINILKQLKGHKHLIIGNHDSNKRLERYQEENIFESIQYATLLKYNNYHFYLSHYPTLCSNYDMGKSLKTRVINLCGHTHTTNKFIDMKLGLIYHCELDAHNCKPVLIDDIITDIRLYLKENII